MNKGNEETDETPEQGKINNGGNHGSEDDRERRANIESEPMYRNKIASQSGEISEEQSFCRTGATENRKKGDETEP